MPFGVTLGAFGGGTGESLSRFSACQLTQRSEHRAVRDRYAVGLNYFG